MKVMIVGNGGREHTLLWKLAKDNPDSTIFMSMGNGGTGDLASHIPISPSDVEGLSQFAVEERIDLTVVGPELPLSLGIVDVFEEKGLKIFGPSKEAAMLETNKAFAKDLMRKHGVSTADYAIFRDYAEAKAYVEKCDIPIVIKASGLAAGKGAVVCNERGEALDALSKMMEERIFDEAGDEVVVEECMQGEELSVFCLTDGEKYLTMIPSQDHKPIFDGDTGPNTGGMGAYAPVSIADQTLQENVKSEVFEPVIKAMVEAGTPYRGILYAGLMITRDGPKVVEFNCRFGDPEAQVVLPLLEDNLLDLLIGVSEGNLKADKLSWKDETAVCVVLASAGYPGSYEKGMEVSIEENARSMEDVIFFHAGTRKEGERLLTNGGRVIGVTALGGNIQIAMDRVYEACNGVHFVGKYHRNDIGFKERERQGIY
jgi:phosphoribosylamine--glycine ligase